MSGDGGSRTHVLIGASDRRSQSASPSEARATACAARASVRTGGVEPPQPEATRLQRGELSRAQRPQEWRGWDSNPRSRAHEAREDSPSSTARWIWPAGVEPAISGSRNRRVDRLPYSQAASCASGNPLARIPHAWTPEGARFAVATTCGRRESRARPWRCPGSRRPWSRTTLDRRIRAAPARPAGRRGCDFELGDPAAQAAGFRDLRAIGSRASGFRSCAQSGASPGSRTLLDGFTTRGLATSLATQSRREESNPHRPR